MSHFFWLFSDKNNVLAFACTDAEGLEDAKTIANLPLGVLVPDSHSVLGVNLLNFLHDMFLFNSFGLLYGLQYLSGNHFLEI